MILQPVIQEHEAIASGIDISDHASLCAFAGNLSFDSFMKQESDLALGEQKLYETDFLLVLPKFTHIRFMITSDDVIHS